MSFVGAIFKKPKFNGSPLQLSLQTDDPRKLVMGRTSTAGTFIFKSLSDRDFGDNRNLNFIFVLAGHECNALRRVWAGGELIAPDGANAYPHGVRVPIRTFRDDGRTRMWVTFYDGRPNQIADPWMTSQPMRPKRWTGTDRLRGCAYAIVTMQHDADTMNAPKDMLFEVEGAKFYDRRRDTTAGGDGPQRWNNPSSWVYTTNPAVIADHYQLGRVGGLNNDKLIFGMGLSEWQVPFYEFRENADVCDERVSSGGAATVDMSELSASQVVSAQNIFTAAAAARAQELGILIEPSDDDIASAIASVTGASGTTMNRYEANGQISAGDDHKDNISEIAAAMAAKPYDTGGRIFLRPQQARPITLTLTDDDLVAGGSYDLLISPGGTELVNTIKGSFRDPEGKYNNQPYPTVSDDELIARDGRPFESTLDLPLETNPVRAQRLATIELEVQKRRDKLEETFMPIANIVNVGDWIERVSNLRGPSTKVYEVINKRTNSDLTVSIEARETDASISAFGAEQPREVHLPEPLPPLEISFPEPPQTELVTIERSSGGAIQPAVDITVIPPEEEDFESVEYFEVEYGPSNGLTGDDLAIVEGQSSFQTFANMGQRILPIEALLPAQIYLYRIRNIYDNRPGPYGPFQTFLSTDKTVSTDANALGGRPSVIALGEIDANRLSVLDLVAVFGSTSSAAASATAALEALGIVQAAEQSILSVQDIIEMSEDAIRLLELSASASAGEASASKDAAASSVTEADGIRTAVAALETLAAESRNEAQQHAQASLQHAEAAETHSDAAGVHSQVSLAERLLATTAAEQANISLQRTRPSTFDNGGKNFSVNANFRASFEEALGADADAHILANTDADGPYLEKITPTITRSIIQKGGLPYIAGKTYRVTAILKAQSGSGTIQIRGRRMDADYISQGLHNTPNILFNSSSPEIHTFDFVATEAHANSGTKNILAEILSIGGGTLVPRFYFLDIEDVTIETLAQSHAQASANHASNAEAHSDDAEDFAQASLGHSVDAQTEAGQAQVSALSAVASAADAFGHSNSAQQTLELTARAALSSHMNNPQFLDWDETNSTGFPAGVSHFSTNNHHSRETSLARTVNAIRLSPPSDVQNGFFQSTRIKYAGKFGLNPNDVFSRHVVLSAWVMLVEGTFEGSGIFMSGRTSTGPISGGNARLHFHEEEPNPELGKWYRFERFFEIPVSGYEEQVLHVDVFGFSSWNGFGSGVLKSKTILFDNLIYREATAEEIRQGEAISQLDANVTQTSQALTNIEGDLASRFGVQVKAGTNGAELELVSLDGTNQGSLARLAGNEIILDGTLEAAHFADGSLYNLAVESSFAIHNLGQQEIEVASRVFTSAGKIVRFDVSGLGVMGLDGIQGNQALAIGIQGFEIWLSLYRDNQLVISGQRFTDLLSFTADGGGTYQPSPSRRGSLVLATTPPAGVHLYSLRAQRIWTAVAGAGQPVITPKLQDVQMLITEVDN